LIFHATNFLQPTSRYTYNLETSELKLLEKSPDRFDSSPYKVEQQFSVSKDGTKVPYYLVAKKDVKFNGKNPTIINAYGGFEVSETPFYSFAVGLSWLEQGGVFVLANIRGGGEYGPNWHKAAIKKNRQRAYDDFHSVAEDLISKKITSPRNLGIYGGSNGGLLMGVAITQRPDLYNAAAIQVPLLDMLRYHLLLAGASWVGEYGNPDDPEMREYLKGYSPYHNVFPDKNYPEVFFMTSTADDRVHPGHARRMAHKMESQGHKFLYYENTEGGHSGSSNNEQRATWWALQYVYFLQKLGNP
jgi:prolyl oligopeptidase